jgi:hypothetical protein
VRTLRVREWCRHDRDDSPVNNQQRNLDAHIGSYIFHKDLYRLNLIWQHTLFPLSGGMLLARDSIIGIPIPSSISLPASLFTRSVIRHLATNSFSHGACKASVMLYYREGPEIPFRQAEWQIPILIHANSTNTFGDTCSAPLWSPSYVVTFDTLKVFLRYPGVAWSHGRRNMYLT